MILPATPLFLQKEAAISVENVSSMDWMMEVERKEFNLMRRQVNYLRLCEAIKDALRDCNLNDPLGPTSCKEPLFLKCKKRELNAVEKALNQKGEADGAEKTEKSPLYDSKVSGHQ